MRRAALIVTVLIAVLVPTAVEAVEPHVSLRLSSSHGPATQRITIYYQGLWMKDRSCLPGKVFFYWDGKALGNRALSGRYDVNRCKVTFAFVPPAGKNSLGKHTVHAEFFNDNCCFHVLQASYSVDRPVRIQPSTKPVAKPSPSVAALPSTSPSVVASPSEVASSASESPLLSPSEPIVEIKSADGPSWELFGVGGLLLAVVGGALFFWLSRRGRRDQGRSETVTLTPRP